MSWSIPILAATIVSLLSVAISSDPTSPQLPSAHFRIPRANYKLLLRRHTYYKKVLLPIVSKTLFPLKSSASRTVSKATCNVRRSFESCQATKQCRGNRKCFSLISRDSECTMGEPCICIPPTITYCKSNADCTQGEVCVHSVYEVRPLCASPREEKASPLLALVSDPPALPSQGYSFDRCDRNSPCTGALQCVSFSDFSEFSGCRGPGPCFCFNPLPCFSNADCNAAEFCSGVTLFAASVCASRKQEASLPSIDKIKQPKGPKGFTLDSCRKNTDCREDRWCSSFVEARTPCNGRNNCACVPRRRKKCKLTSECGRREVCATHSFDLSLPSPICISVSARDTHESIQQIFNLDACPVRINRDRPVNMFDDQTATSRRSVRELSQSNESLDGNEGGADLEVSEKVVGGLFSPPNVVRFMVVLQNANRTSLCTGTLLSPTWVLSAGHCNLKVGDVAFLGATQAFFPANNKRDRDRKMRKHGISISIKRVIVHPKFVDDLSAKFDVAVLELAEAAPMGSGFMRINDDVSVPKRKEPVRIIGFGDTSRNDELRDPLRLALRQVDLLVSGFKFCRDAYLQLGILVSRTDNLCLGSQEDRCAACLGDSGGPAVQYEASVPTIVGVSSTGVGCGVIGFPNLYSPIAGSIAWLKTTPAIFYTRGGVFGEDAKGCPPGSFVINYLPGVQFCRSCPSNSYSNGGLSTECSLCPNGLVRDSENGSKCSCAGRYALGRGMKSGKCQECKPGEYSGMGDNVCIPCGLGTVSTMSGAHVCEKCSKNFFTDTRGSTSCKRCTRDRKRTTLCGMGAKWQL